MRPSLSLEGVSDQMTGPTSPRMQSLGRGLAVLDQLVHADHALTATELARRCGMHQTTASRILADLIVVGYVRKVSYREFAPDFGLLALGVESIRHFSLLAKPRLAMERAAAICSGLSVSLCMLWREKLLYFDRAAYGFDTQVFSGDDYPLHLSSPGLLFMIELPERQAIRQLAESRRKLGWSQPTAAIPPTEKDLLRAARRQYRHDTLVLAEWAGTGHISAAVRLSDHDGHPLAVAISGPSDILTTETIRLRLHEIRRLVEDALPPPSARRGSETADHRR